MVDPVIQLKCYCNNYPWGKKGTESRAAIYCSKTPDTDFTIDNETEYAEMWFGTYPTTPSYVLSSGELLQDVLNANKEALIGKKVLSKFGSDLPFLPKILSIAKALPLQLHPDKDLASRLHQKDPEKFGDSNHKPEIAVALGKFEVFVGFRPSADIQELMNLVPALHEFIPADSKAADAKFTDSTIRQICTSLLTASPEKVSSLHKALSETSPKTYGAKHRYILDLLPRLAQQYDAEDNGNLVALLLMNFLVLQAGEAIYVPANGMHAYLSGDIVECMARSDNVLNTGFCPRADRDSVDVFASALTFEQHSPAQPVLTREKSEKSRKGGTGVFRPPLSEFDMLVTELAGGEGDVVGEVEGPSVMTVTEGEGRMKVQGKEYELKEGWIFYVGCGVEVEFEAGSKRLVVYRAYAE